MYNNFDTIEVCNTLSTEIGIQINILTNWEAKLLGK